jgi:hypothetical protein
MIRTFLTLRSFTILLLACSLFLQGCAAINESGSKIKTGMYIDAVLECAIEYPITWSKDRRLNYGTQSGELRWKPPQADATLLRLISQERNADEPEQQIARLYQEFTGLEISMQEEVTLPVGNATHIIGSTAERHFEIYHYSNANRNYLVFLTTLKGNTKLYSGVMDKVINSFQVMQ